MAPPILMAALQSTFINFCSCMFATFFTEKVPPTIAILIFTFLSTPPNYLWQEYLERVFPGYTTEKLDLDDGGKGINVGKRLHKRNTMKKVVLDQTLGAVVNVMAFLGGVRLLRGVSLEESLKVVKEQTWPLMMAGYKLWPAVSLINFTLVPVERRTLVGSLVGLGWGVYLALRASD
ncbi:hypothetical protein MMC07_001961 [Pseudocyphellaria aurata]|nr:hypothetical protein [Pseudocyphellaria aurata]